MQISIVKPGILTTVQDLGRKAHLAEAVPVSGAMDLLSASLANIACGNNIDCAVIEVTYADFSFTADSGVLIAYCGDGAYLQAGQTELQPGKAVYIPAGAAITSVRNEKGCRTYLAVAGGWDVPVVMGSRSTCLVAGFGGYHGRALKRGDVLTSIKNLTAVSNSILVSLRNSMVKRANWLVAREMFLPANKSSIRVIPGPEFTRFSAFSIIHFLSKPYTLLGESNRMGYRLGGEKMVTIDNTQMISTAVTPGTIQITGDGLPILLMADCQTTGGYPRIAQVALVDMPLCAQLKPGDEINFSEISLQEAEMLYIERQEELKQLQLAVRAKYLKL